MEQRVSIISLGVKDLTQSRKFYEEGLGWTPTQVEENIVFYQLPGIALGLYPHDLLAEDIGISPDGDGFGGITIAYNARTKEEVHQVIEQARRAGAKVLKEPQDVFWGGYSSYFEDPNGHPWEVAFNPFSPILEDGSIDMTPKS